MLATPPFRRACSIALLGLNSNHHLKWWLVTLMNDYDVELEILQKDVIHIIRDLQWNKIIKLSKKPIME